MEKLLSENDGFKTYVEVNGVLKPAGHKQIKIFTVWEKIKSSNNKQIKYTIVLSEEELSSLQQFLANI